MHNRDYYLERCHNFVEDVSAHYPNIEVLIVKGADFDWSRVVRLFVSGLSEQAVRDRQMSMPAINPGNLFQHIKLKLEQGNPDIFLNWGDCSHMIKISYDSFISCDRIVDLAWNEIADDLDIIIPHDFLYSLDHHGYVWCQDL